jgi:nucleoid-associated protein YgaU
MSANPQVTDAARLQIGTVLKIPPLPADAEAGASQSSESRQPERDTPKPRSTQRTYRVLPGDSFYRIARDQLGDANRWRELLTLNNALVKGDPRKLKPGQVILLPD